MSIISLTTTEVGRLQRREQAETSRASEASASDAGAGGGAGDTSPDNAASMLVKYIPTESITLYVATMSALPALKNVKEGLTEWHIYFFYGVCTPVIFALILFGQLKAKKLALKSVLDYPWWKTVAATIAFFFWALAVPGEPNIKGDTSGVVAGLAALLGSTLLSLLDPLLDTTSDA